MQSLTVGDEERLFFISDLHLCEARPRTTEAFIAFLAGEARHSDRLFILGDLFEYWIGDDDIPAPGLDVAAALTDLRAHGVQSYFMAGNRDFLLGPDFARLAGLTPIDDPCLVVCGAHRLLLMHGDTLCTDDLAYQAFRRQVRHPAWQADFLARPSAERRALAAQARAQSRQATADKRDEIMDANPEAVRAAFEAAGWPVIIHGHTHRPAEHRHDWAGRSLTRWVLPAWEAQAEYLEWQRGQACARSLPVPGEI